ncbi:hypothetical protein PVAP13_5NG005508 [Panicum virgatum]|uniref:Uncharacterized protein n=1 Tax=Panicum virgatum TaxID=38727 RepID=A0A8T0RM98_PANVG|nr:hypothetical protein PVAP13_5NG005508 [Panicum virgatum]
MENPQFIFPTQGQSKLTMEDIDIVLNRPPLFVLFSSDQGLGNKEIEEPIEMPSAHQTRRQRVPPGERQNHLVCRNLLFEATIGRKYLGPPDAANEIPDVVNAPTQSSVINTGATDPKQAQHANPQTQESVVGASIVEDEVVDDDVVFEEDEEEDEGYLFAGQEQEDEVDVEINLDDEDNGVLDVLDPYDKVYANVPAETHKLEAVNNCEQCNAKKVEYETLGFCCRNGQIRLSTPDTPPELMRLWTASDADTRHFRSNIRFFNGHFSFTSLYCNLDRMTASMRNGGV